MLLKKQQQLLCLNSSRGKSAYTYFLIVSTSNEVIFNAKQSYATVPSSNPCVEGKDVDVIDFPAYQAGTEGAKITVSFKELEKLTSQFLVKHAYLKFYPAADSSPSNTYQYLINVQLRESEPQCWESADGEYTELVRHVTWNITTSWNEAVSVVTPDLSTLINFMLRKPTWKDDQTLTFVFVPVVVDSSATYSNSVNMTLTELFVAYEYTSPSKLLSLLTICNIYHSVVLPRS